MDQEEIKYKMINWLVQLFGIKLMSIKFLSYIILFLDFCVLIF